MDIGPAAAPQAATALKAALARMDEVSGGYRALMFVSVNAVRYFFSHPLVLAAGIHAPSMATRCWSPGPGTSQALREAGAAHTH